MKLLTLLICALACHAETVTFSGIYSSVCFDKQEEKVPCGVPRGLFTPGAKFSGSVTFKPSAKEGPIQSARWSMVEDKSIVTGVPGRGLVSSVSKGTIILIGKTTIGPFCTNAGHTTHYVLVVKAAVATAACTDNGADWVTVKISDWEFSSTR